MAVLWRKSIATATFANKGLWLAPRSSECSFLEFRRA